MLVELNIIELKKMQKEMDVEAAKVHGLDMNSRKWFENRIMAIIGELYETMAVVEDFKDWKKNKGKVDLKRFKAAELADKEYIQGILRQHNVRIDYVDKNKGTPHTKKMQSI